MTSVVGRVSRLASGQWGMLTTAQAVKEGVSRVVLSRLCDSGALERVGQGIYVQPGAADKLTPVRAAWLAMDPSATAEQRLAEPIRSGVVSHASAAALHQLGDLDADVTEITVPGRKRTERPGTRIHQAHLTPEDVTIVSGLPVTTVERTVADLLRSRRHGDPAHVASIVGEALLEDRLDTRQLAAQLEPLASRYGQDSGESFTSWLIDLSGNSPEALAARLGSTAIGRQVVAASFANAFTDETSSVIRHAVAAIAGWVADHPEAGRDLQTARAALAEPEVAAALDAVRGIPADELRAIRKIHREVSSPVTQRHVREAQRAWAQVDPSVVQAIRAIGGSQ